MPNKVAILYSGGRGIAGIEKYLIDLFNNIDKAQIELQLLSLGKWDLTKSLVESGEKVQIFNPKRIRLETVKEIGQYCIENNIELLVSQGVVANAYGRLVAKKFNIKNLVTVHSDMNSEYDNPVIKATYKIVDRLLRRYTTGYIAVSQFIKSLLVSSGVSGKLVTVVHNGAEFVAAGPRAHKRLIIGSMGRLETVKGFDLLIRAFAALDNKRLRLRIGGDGSQLDNLKKLTVELGVDRRVEFVGYKKDYNKFLDSIDVYVQPSRSEGFGLATILAMGQNLPVVVTPAGALPEIVVDGQTGYVCRGVSAESLAAAIKKAVEDIAGSTKIGENAGKFVRQSYSIEEWVNQTTKAYKEAIK